MLTIGLLSLLIATPILMTREYIPYHDAEFVAWMNNFLTVLNANLATFGLVAADLTPFKVA